jgi:hypothetical protein
VYCVANVCVGLLRGVAARLAEHTSLGASRARATGHEINRLWTRILERSSNEVYQSRPGA